jgi:hypothetical protein
VEDGTDLLDWSTIQISKPPPAKAATAEAGCDPPLPALGAGWEWATSRTASNTNAAPRHFTRLRVER